MRGMWRKRLVQKLRLCKDNDVVEERFNVEDVACQDFHTSLRMVQGKEFVEGYEMGEYFCTT